MLPPHTLTLFSASAGSGKTHQLVQSYLHLCLSQTDPGHFYQVLAITFTNKATAEMKTRIVDSLIAWVGRSEKGAEEVMKKALMAELSMDEASFLGRAERMLRHLLHHYGYFSVTTIDSFTHRIIRQFAQDLDLPAAFELELDEELLIEEACDLILDRYGKDEALSRILREYALYRSEDSEASWQIRYTIIDQLKAHLKEPEQGGLRPFIEQELPSLIDRLEKLKALEAKVRNELAERARDALGSMEQAGLEHSDFSYGDLPNFWKKLLLPSIDKPPKIGSRLKEQLEGTRTLYKKAEEGTEKGKTIQAVGDQLGPECLAVQDDYTYWKKLRHIRGQFHSIALLGEVLGSLQDIKDERNLVLMHELGSLIAKELREQPSAYLFERLGERYEQLFIDEFQDTSLEQWNNLQPFVEEITSSGGQVLLVGDAKQAIYRWRGGDIGQFVDLYQRGKKQEPGFALKELQTNYRSLPAVVDFNRDFFTYCAEKLGANQRYKDLYAASGQDAHHKAPEGRVEIRRFEAEKAAEYNEQQDEDLIALIKELIEKKGYIAGEIALLYRSKKEAIRLIPKLLSANIPVASAQGEELGSSHEVGLLVDLLRLTVDPLNTQAQYGLVRYLKIAGRMDAADSDHLAREIGKGDVWRSLSAAFPDLKKPELSLGTHELLQHWIRVFGLEGSSDAYLWGFLSESVHKGGKQSTDPVDLIKWWEKKGEKKTVEQAERMEAICLMTIHKAKGLQFPVVIVPNCDWATNKLTEHFYWDELDPERYAGLNRFPFKAMKWEGIGGPLEKTWNTSVLDTYLDNINLLYVAFTRAEQQLFIYAKKKIEEKKKKDKEEGSSIMHLVQEFLESHGEGEGSLYARGSMPEKRREYKDETDDEKCLPVHLHSKDWPSEVELVIRPQFSEEQGFGQQFHEAAALCRSMEDLAQLRDTRPEWTERIDELLRQLTEEPFRVFFCGHPFMNERSVSTANGQTYRPDRMVVDEAGKLHILDYKTGAQKAAHEEQIDTYKKVLEAAGYSVGSSCLLYI